MPCPRYANGAEMSDALALRMRELLTPSLRPPSLTPQRLSFAPLPPFFQSQGGEKFGGFVNFQVIYITKSAILATLPSSPICR